MSMRELSAVPNLMTLLEAPEAVLALNPRATLDAMDLLRFPELWAALRAGETVWCLGREWDLRDGTLYGLRSGLAQRQQGASHA